MLKKKLLIKNMFEDETMAEKIGDQKQESDDIVKSQVILKNKP